MAEITENVKALIIKQKLEQYNQQYFDLSLEMEIAEEVGNDRLLEQSKTNMVNIKKALRLLERKLATYKGEDTPEKKE